MLGAGLINMFKVSITAVLNTFSAWWHMIGVLVLVGIMIIVPDHHQSFHYVFGQTINNTGLGGTTTHGFIYVYVFLTGLLLAQYTITGYDASAHMSEETRSASLGAAWGMVMSVVVSVVFGFILLVAVTFVIPAKGPSDLSAFIVQSIWTDSMGTKWAEFLIFVAVVAQCFCTIASTTSASRMMFAFSRDRAVPGHQLWKRVSKRDRIPVYTVWAICVLAFLTPLPALWWGFVGYYAATAVAVIGLYIAFVIPIILRLRAGESFERTAWSLGKYYKIVDWIAIIWIFGICLVFMLPAYQGGIPFKSNFDWNLFNYTPLPVFAAFLLFGGWYVLSARKWFKGPVRQGRRGARADRGRLRRAGSPGDLARGPGVVLVRTAGGLQARPPALASLSRVHRLTKKQARRIAVRAQLLDAPRPQDLLEVVERLTLLQVDPTAAIAPNADLVAWSRLGASYRPEHLTRALEQDRTLFEFNALIRPMSDLGLYLADAGGRRGHAERCTPGSATTTASGGTS